MDLDRRLARAVRRGGFVESELKWRCVGILGLCLRVSRAGGLPQYCLYDRRSALQHSALQHRSFESVRYGYLNFWLGALGEVDVECSIFQAFSLTFCAIFLLDIKRLERTRSSSSLRRRDLPALVNFI